MDRFSIAGFGMDGIPCLFRRMFRDGGDVALNEHIWRETDQSEEAKIVSLVMDEWRGDPPDRLRARAAVMGVLSPDTGLPLLSAATREALGLPPRINKHREFLEAAGRMAIATALTAKLDTAGAAEPILAQLRLIVERTQDGHQAISDNALSEASARSWEFADDDKLQRAEHVRRGVSRSTIKDWRTKPDCAPQFWHIVREVAGHLAMRMNVPDSISDNGIRLVATRFPTADVLTLVGEVPTVWSVTPARPMDAGRQLKQRARPPVDFF